jgi:DNA polymerase III subunit delta'
VSVWDDLVGQQPTADTLRRAVTAAGQVLAGHPASGMTHAWLFTGPPGSGRSNTARAFAAALLCERAGCGECLSCRTALAGSHSDVTLVRTESLSIGVDEVRELVRKAAMSPTGRRWQVLVVEDADRLTDRAGDALLKSLEEPAERTIWLLCAPTVEDVLPTVRSRSRLLVLRTPPAEAVAEMLVRRDGVSEALAMFAARASQGHIGRARALASDESTRNRRHEVLSLPGRLADVGSCITAAANLVEAAAEEAGPIAGDLEARERADLEQAYGVGVKGTRPRGAAAAIRGLEAEHKSRRKRLERDCIDRGLVDLLSFYRDVITAQITASTPLVNEEMRSSVEMLARGSTPEQSLRRLDAILEAREALEANVAPTLALESMMLSLR